MTSLKVGDRAMINGVKGTVDSVLEDTVRFITDDGSFQGWAPSAFLTKIKPFFENGEKVLVEMIVNDSSPMSTDRIALGEISYIDNFINVERKYVRKFTEVENAD